ncbi:VOC family protein [Falsiroseomonas oryzae]|uniref:VOC family protein n=1 Tax=Falsiroseomonas oryzae TaxID=2766473 RepID=UPI0022EB1A8F|nr:VOC family protein [Roseomonas sp. MO-31]
MNTALALDHVGLCTRDPAPLWAAWEALGFALSPVAQQSGRRTPDAPVEPFGTVNRCAFLRHGYIELLGIADPMLFANGVDRFVARYAGAHILALAMDDAEANLARLRRGGLDIPGIAWLQRPVEPGGPIARFARLPFPDAPEGRVQLVQHLTPELVWDARWMGHRNGAEALESAILASADPAETTVRLARLSGLPAEPDSLAGFRLRLPGGARAAGPDSPRMETVIRILPQEALPRALPGVTAPALPFMAGMVIRTADKAASARALLAHLPLRDMPGGAGFPGGFMVPPEHAGGAAVVFA